MEWGWDTWAMMYVKGYANEKSLRNTVLKYRNIHQVEKYQQEIPNKNISAVI